MIAKGCRCEVCEASRRAEGDAEVVTLDRWPKWRVAAWAVLAGWVAACLVISILMRVAS